MISKHDIERVMNCAAIEQVVARYISLHKRGTNYIGLCPFHPDKHPSFRVSPSRKLCKCFSCNEGGNAVSFVRKMEKCSFIDAVKIVASICHIAININGQQEPYLQPTKRPEPVPSDTNLPATAPTPETVSQIENFLHSLLPSDTGIPLLNSVYQKEGIGIAPYSVPPGFGAFRNRLIFPLRNADGILVGVAGRAIGKKSPKYINPPHTAWYHKRELLYNFAEAREAILLYKTCFVVEGYKDALAMRAAGIQHVVALAGTAFTTEQLALLKQVTPHIILALDGDAPGRKAAASCQQTIESAGITCTVIEWEADADPDSYFCQHGKTALIRYLSAQFLIHNTTQWQLPATALLRFVLAYQDEVVQTEQHCTVALPAYVMQVLEDEHCLFTHALHTELLEWMARGVPSNQIPDAQLSVLARALLASGTDNRPYSNRVCFTRYVHCQVYGYIEAVLSQQLAQLLEIPPYTSHHNPPHTPISTLLAKRERITKMTELCSVRVVDKR